MNRAHTIVSLCAITAAAGLLLAGPLNPPAGPVTPSYKTLADVEPRTIINAANTPGDAQHEFIISQPGSYYLAATLNIGGPKHAIKIAADNVTIDLNGFSMVCTAETAGTAITSAGVARSNIRVLNGAIRGGFQGGINLQGIGHRAQGVHIQGTFGDGIRAGAQATIRDCVATSNSGYGILTGNESTISGCSCDANTMSGFFISNQSVIDHCTANNGTGGSASGISAGTSCVIHDCVANSNPGYGIQTYYLCRVEDCTSANNTYVNFEIGPDNVVRGCTARSGTNGFYADFGCTLTDCQADLSSMDGIRCNGNALVQNCRAQSNGHDGINGGFGSTILNCQAGNNLDAGIEVFGKGRVEGNDCISNAVGLRATGTGGLFILNSATSSTSTNYSIAVGNVAGPVVTAATIATTTNPAANFSY